MVSQQQARAQPSIGVAHGGSDRFGGSGTTKPKTAEWGTKATAERYARYISPDVELRFGTNEPIRVLSAVVASMSQMSTVISTMKHEMVGIHFDMSIAHAAVELIVSYTRASGSKLVVPGVAMLKLDAQDLITEYRRYVNPEGLFSSVSLQD